MTQRIQNSHAYGFRVQCTNGNVYEQDYETPVPFEETEAAIDALTKGETIEIRSIYTSPKIVRTYGKPE